MPDSRDRFYEAYWSKEAKAVTEDDPTTEQRKRLLAMALAKFLAESGTDRQAGKILDAGCGRGEFSAFMRGLGYEVVGIDIAPAALEKARKVCPDASFYIGSLEDKLPFHDGEFDAIWCTEVLERLFDVHACLSESNRVLREGGS